MLFMLKIKTTALLIGITVFMASISTSSVKMFGKLYQQDKDFSCCKADQLVIHHFYKLNVFWIPVSEGYTEENTGKAAPGGCNIHCTE
jgi:hypothetical protein